MSCDIYAHTEVKINGHWEHWSALSIRRNYDLFSRMADVRNDGNVEPISQPRGIPYDASPVTRFDYDRWGVDAHSASWLSGKEMEELEEWWKSQPWVDKNKASWWLYDTFGYLFGNGWDVAKYPDQYPKGVEDARVVFWFDN